MDKPQEGPARSGFFEAEQFEAVRRRLRPDLQVAVTIGDVFGWRKAEVLGLERRHVDLDAGTLRLDLGSTTNGEGRVVYLTPEVARLLGEQLGRVELLQKQLGLIVPHLFPHDRVATAGTAGHELRQGVVHGVPEGRGVPGRLVHDVRRTGVRNMERQGVPRSVAIKLTGHKTESVYRRYAIVSDADLRDAARRLTGAFPGALPCPLPAAPAGRAARTAPRPHTRGRTFDGPSLDDLVRRTVWRGACPGHRGAILPEPWTRSNGSVTGTAAGRALRNAAR